MLVRMQGNVLKKKSHDFTVNRLRASYRLWITVGDGTKEKKSRPACVSLFKSDGSEEGIGDIQRGPYGGHGHAVTADERQCGSVGEQCQ